MPTSEIQAILKAMEAMTVNMESISGQMADLKTSFTKTTDAQWKRIDEINESVTKIRDKLAYSAGFKDGIQKAETYEESTYRKGQSDGNIKAQVEGGGKLLWGLVGVLMSLISGILVYYFTKGIAK